MPYHIGCPGLGSPHEREKIRPSKRDDILYGWIWSDFE